MSEFKEKVNTLVGQMTQDTAGKWVLPEEVSKDLDEPTMFAITAERRYRDTQGAFTKVSQEAKQHRAIAEALQDRILSSDIKLTTTQRQELTALQKTNPEAWRTKLNEYEIQAKESVRTEIAEIAKNAGTKTELEIRGEQMAVWSEKTGIALNDDIVNNELPPRLVKQLGAGTITFENFLEKAGEYLSKEKIIAGTNDKDENEPNLSKAAGGSEPQERAQEADLSATYTKTIF